jgi:type 1 glutamine amidotransferase
MRFEQLRVEAEFVAHGDWVEQRFTVVNLTERSGTLRTSSCFDLQSHPQFYDRELLRTYAPETGGTGEHEPMLITVRYGRGRTFQTMMGDGPPGMACVGFWVTLQRGAEWATTGTVTSTEVPDDFPDETTVRIRR